MVQISDIANVNNICYQQILYIYKAPHATMIQFHWNIPFKTTILLETKAEKL